MALEGEMLDWRSVIFHLVAVSLNFAGRRLSFLENVALPHGKSWGGQFTFTFTLSKAWRRMALTLAGVCVGVTIDSYLRARVIGWMQGRCVIQQGRDGVVGEAEGGRQRVAGRMRWSLP